MVLDILNVMAIVLAALVTSLVGWFMIGLGLGKVMFPPDEGLGIVWFAVMAAIVGTAGTMVTVGVVLIR
jgi:hypothetical protein